jgi:hypothetical protein
MLYPSCPYNNSVILLILRLAVIVLGTVGLSFLNIWIAGGYLLYSIVYNVFVWPVIHCQYCYYKVKENNKLLPLEEWKKAYLDKHVACGKRWGTPNLMILWLAPIILIGISLILNFSLYALISLISFIVVLAGLGLYTRWRVCLTCAFQKECHAAFS